MKYNLNIDYKPKKFNLQKPKRYKLINPQFLTKILNSEFYNSSFDDPISNGLKLDDLNYRCTTEQKERWINLIINGDIKILKIREKRNFVILTCKSVKEGPVRYVTFFDDKKPLLEGEYDDVKEEKPEIKTTKKKNRLYNDTNQSRTKKRGRRKSKRK